MFILDSDTYTHLLHEHPKVEFRLQEAIAQHNVVGVTIVTKIEVLQGRMTAVLKADTHDRFLQRQREFLAAEKRLEEMPILFLNERALQVFDELTKIRGLKKIGRTDLLIAGIVRAENATLVTRNQRHFKLVPQLKLANWVD